MTTQDFKAPALHSGHGSYKPSSTHTRASEWEHSSTSVGRAVPLKQEKLEALHELVNEQLNKRHIVESFSPWNSPVFFVQKKSGKWRMLTDLRAVNAAIVPMGALQPGLPNPSMILFNDPVVVGNLISGPSAFSKSSLNIWKFTVHVLLKPGLKNFERYFTSCEMSAIVY